MLNYTDTVAISNVSKITLVLMYWEDLLLYVYFLLPMVGYLLQRYQLLLSENVWKKRDYIFGLHLHYLVILRKFILNVGSVHTFQGFF